MGGSRFLRILVLGSRVVGKGTCCKLAALIIPACPMKRFPLLFAALVFLFVGTDAARALTVVPRDFDELVTGADTVFKGAVTATTPSWVGDGENRHIVTRVTFRVEETY